MINIGEFINTLPIMLYGMAGVFIVILLIFLVIKLMCWVFPEKSV